MVELHGIGADRLLVGLEVVDPGADVLAAHAVRAQDDLLADVHGAEAGGAGEDVDEVVDLVLTQRIDLGPLDRRLHPGLDLRLDRGATHPDQ